MPIRDMDAEGGHGRIPINLIISSGCLLDSSVKITTWRVLHNVTHYSATTCGDNDCQFIPLIITPTIERCFGGLVMAARAN